MPYALITSFVGCFDMFLLDGLVNPFFIPHDINFKETTAWSNEVMEVIQVHLVNCLCFLSKQFGKVHNAWRYGLRMMCFSFSQTVSGGSCILGCMMHSTVADLAGCCHVLVIVVLLHYHHCCCHCCPLFIHLCLQWQLLLCWGTLLQQAISRHHQWINALQIYWWKAEILLHPIVSISQKMQSSSSWWFCACSLFNGLHISKTCIWILASTFSLAQSCIIAQMTAVGIC